MPYVNIKITKENEVPTKEQKERIISGLKQLLGEVLNRNMDSLVVVIDEIDCDNYGIGGITITQKRKESLNNARQNNKSNKKSTKQAHKKGAQ